MFLLFKNYFKIDPYGFGLKVGYISLVNKRD